MYMCPIPKGFRNRTVPLYSSKIVHKKEILLVFIVHVTKLVQFT
jgi:hypothetical protein